MNNKPPRLYILCGLSFAGKSTLSRQLAEPLDAQIVEADSYIEAVRPNTLTKLQEWRQIQNLARGETRTLLQFGKNVIFDDLMTDPVNRDEMDILAKECGATSLTIFVNTSARLVRERQQLRSPAPEQQAIWDDHTALLLSQLIAPSPDKSVHVEPGYSLPDILEKIARFDR